MGATRLASGTVQLLFSRVYILFFHYPDARRVALLVLAFLQALSATSKRYHQTLTLMGATRLASGIVQLLFSRARILFFHYPDARRGC